MNNQHIVIDDSWYCRLPAAKERIAAGGIGLRQEYQRVYLAIAREADFPSFVLPKGKVEPNEPLNCRPIDRSDERFLDGTEPRILHLNCIPSPE